MEPNNDGPLPKIIPLFKGVEIPLNDGGAPPAPESIRIDQQAITLLEDVLDRVKKGELYGVGVAACYQNENALCGATTYISDAGLENCLLMVGAISVLKRRAMDEMEPGGEFDE